VKAGDSLRRLRETKPLIHQITNYVVMNETANATLAALLARGLPLAEAARGAARAASDAVLHGLAELGAGDGPVDILDLKGRHEHR